MDFFKSRFEYMWNKDKGRRIPPLLVHVGHMGMVFVPSVLLQKWFLHFLDVGLFWYTKNVSIITILIPIVILIAVVLVLESGGLRSDNPDKRKDSFWDSYQMFMGAVLAAFPAGLDAIIFPIVFIIYFLFVKKMKG